MTYMTAAHSPRVHFCIDMLRYFVSHTIITLLTWMLTMFSIAQYPDILGYQELRINQYGSYVLHILLTSSLIAGSLGLVFGLILYYGVKDKRIELLRLWTFYCIICWTGNFSILVALPLYAAVLIILATLCLTILGISEVWNLIDKIKQSQNRNQTKRSNTPKGSFSNKSEVPPVSVEMETLCMLKPV